MKDQVTIEDIKLAQQRLAKVVTKTPLDQSTTFSKIAGCNVFLKLENMQKTGSFKIRGAGNCIASLSDAERAKGVIAASAGNHAQGVALGATRFGVKSTIVMPEPAPLSKVEATRGYGAEVVLHGTYYDEANAEARRIQEQTGQTFVHAFDNPQVIAGQGTVALEMLAQNPNLKSIAVPIGGGGLLAGIAVAVKALAPQIKVYGVQSSGAPSMYLSRNAGKIIQTAEANTLADGIAVKRPGEITFDLIQKYVDDIVVVSEEEIMEAVERGVVTAMMNNGGFGGSSPEYIMNSIKVNERELARIVTKAQSNTEYRMNPSPAY